MSNLLINEPPLVVLPSLAVKIGLGPAIVLQQIQYWSTRVKQSEDGYFWVYNTIEEWNKQFPFWHQNTISTHLKKLRDSGILIAEFRAESALNRTLFYRIDYTKLGDTIPQKLCNEIHKNCDIPIYTETTKEYSDYFLKFWKVYPSKKAKEAAWKAFKKLKVDDDFLAMLIKAINQQGLPSRDIQFVPHASTWLNGKRWEDEVSTASSSTNEWWMNDRRIK
jgi:DNA-binding transcriptional ArsR family regulator